MILNFPKWSVGQIIHHKRFNYRGVIYEVDPTFQGSEEWYEQVAQSRPPKDKPWYHVLVDGNVSTTYVAERNLETDHLKTPVAHPFLAEFFTKFEDGKYIRVYN